MDSSTYGDYEGLPLARHFPYHTVEKHWKVSAPAFPVENEMQSLVENAPIIYTTTSQLSTPANLGETHQIRSDQKKNYVGHSNKVATYLSPSGIVTVQTHEEMTATLPGPASVSHVTSTRVIGPQACDPENQLNLMSHHEAFKENHRTHAEIQTRGRPNLERRTVSSHSSRHSRTQSAQTNGAIGEDNLQLVVPESTKMTAAPAAEPAATAVKTLKTRTTEPTTQSQANRQRVRMEQREKIKEEILKRRELETPCTTESLLSAESTKSARSTTTTPNSVLVDSTHPRTTGSHQNGSIQERTSEKRIFEADKGEELQMGHQSTASTNQLMAVTNEEQIRSDSIRHKGAITRTEKESRKKEPEVSEERVNYPTAVSNLPLPPEPLYEKPKKQTRCCGCGPNRRREKSGDEPGRRPSVSPSPRRSRTGNPDTNIATESVEHGNPIGKVYSQPNDVYGSETFALQMGPATEEKATQRRSGTTVDADTRRKKVTSENSTRSNRQNQQKTQKEDVGKSSHGCCIS